MELENELVTSILMKRDAELIEMLFEFGNWNSSVIKLVSEELIKRGSYPSDFDEKLKNLTNKEHELLRQGKPASMLGKIISCICVFGLLGIYMGYQYMNAKEKSIYDGTEFFKYNTSTREFGKYIFYISISIVVLVFYSKIRNY
jgi:hypothetical protein